MSGARLDKVLFSTFHEAYKNYHTASDTISISGSIANGDGQNFTISLPYTRGGTRADLYLDGNNVKIQPNGSTRLIVGGPYQFISTETASILIAYSSSSITFTISIFNGTGSSVTLTNQTITCSAVEYDAPITAI